MNSFHQWFKDEFNTLYELGDGSFTQRGLSLPMYLESAKRLNAHLTLHHTVEEQHFFPVLAKRMPNFGSGEDHIESHRKIHKGLDDLEALVKKFQSDPTSYRPSEMRNCLDSFRTVLFKHLDDEVADLSGENLKKYWTLEEVDKLGVV
ncbi:hypothetical protein BD779DRAFT_1503431 [Infundibulicybe gibba]|nr:hypothetical protein BD779DRAFT_1503431 [Infundibulicybe gibba]